MRRDVDLRLLRHDRTESAHSDFRDREIGAHRDEYLRGGRVPERANSEVLGHRGGERRRHDDDPLLPAARSLSLLDEDGPCGAVHLGHVHLEHFPEAAPAERHRGHECHVAQLGELASPPLVVPHELEHAFEFLARQELRERTAWLWRLDEPGGIKCSVQPRDALECSVQRAPVRIDGGVVRPACAEPPDPSFEHALLHGELPVEKGAVARGLDEVRAKLAVGRAPRARALLRQSLHAHGACDHLGNACVELSEGGKLERQRTSRRGAALHRAEDLMQEQGEFRLSDRSWPRRVTR
jgi:hypothetical protein